MIMVRPLVISWRTYSPLFAKIETVTSQGTVFTPPALFRAYANYDVDIRNGRTGGAVPVGYDQFSSRWNQDPNSPYRFSTFDPATSTVTTVGAPFPAGFLDLIDPPPAPRAPTPPPPTYEFTEGQHDLIQHMLWSTARRESFFEKKEEGCPCQAGRRPPLEAQGIPRSRLCHGPQLYPGVEDHRCSSRRRDRR